MVQNNLAGHNNESNFKIVDRLWRYLARSDFLYHDVPAFSYPVKGSHRRYHQNKNSKHSLTIVVPYMDESDYYCIV